MKIIKKRIIGAAAASLCALASLTKSRDTSIEWIKKSAARGNKSAKEALVNLSVH